jgi:hypothetical protein
MRSDHFIYFLIVSICLGACIRQAQKHPDFSILAECDVYTNEVITEKYPFGEVDRIDTNKASGCSKSNFKNTYLLYCDNIYIAVYNQHPKEVISDINYFIKKYQTDSTNLSTYTVFDSTINMTINRYCNDDKSMYFGTFIEWRSVEYSIKCKPYNLLKSELLDSYFKWKE